MKGITAVVLMGSNFPYSYTASSVIKVMRIKAMITKKRSSREVLRNSPYQHQRKCIKTGMENMHSDVRL